MSATTSRIMDISARSIDLVSTLAQATSEKSLLVSGVMEIGEWLGREKLNKFDLELCLQKARGLSFPNPDARVFFQAITQGGFSQSVGHLFLKKSGSLGHLLACDPQLQWMVSTVACLFQFESREHVVSNTLCDLVILASDLGDGKDPEGLKTFTLGSRGYPLRTQIKSVLDKVVSSIWLNVVNAGLHTMDLPNELNDVCPRGHHVDGIYFARIATLLHKGHRHIAIRSRHLLRNLVFWILNHFDGRIQVTVSTKKILDRALGDGACALDIIVEQYCPVEGKCGVETSKVDILADISGQLQLVCSGINTDTDTLRPVPGKRRELYTLPTPYSLRNIFDDYAIDTAIRDRAWKIARWLLQLPVGRPAPHSERLAFPVILDRSPTEEEMRYNLTVGSLLGRVPGITNLDWASREKDDQATQTFQANVSKFRDDEDNDSEESEPSSDSLSRPTTFGRSPGHMGGTMDPTRLIQHFPLIKSLLRHLSKRCHCQLCRTPSHKRISNKNLARLQIGCLKNEGLNRLLKLLAHAIADGLGCSKASGANQGPAITEAMGVVLYELVEKRQVVWDTWFQVAAAVALGCPFRSQVGSNHTQRTTLAAIQYGSLSLVAQWLDISRDIQTRHCFSALEQQGRLGVMQRDGDRPSQFREVQDSFAVLQTERTQGNSSYLARSMDDENPSVGGTGVEIGADTSPVESHLFLIQISDGVWGILLRVESIEHSRFIDPADSILGLACRLRGSKCDHLDQLEFTSSTLPDSETEVHVHSFDELLGLWVGRGRIGGSSDISDTGDDGNESCDDENEVDDGNERSETPRPSGGPDRIHMSLLLDDALKVNTALALSMSHRVLLRDINRRRSCIECVSGSRATYVINVDAARDSNRRSIKQSSIN